MHTELNFYLCNILTYTIIYYLTRENIKTRPIPIRPLRCAIHAKCITAQPQGIPFVYAPYVYWKLVQYQNVTPGFEILI